MIEIQFKPSGPWRARDNKTLARYNMKDFDRDVRSMIANSYRARVDGKEMKVNSAEFRQAVEVAMIWAKIKYPND